jgi:type IV pilus assembly protein PilC
MGGQMPAATRAIFSGASFIAKYAWVIGAVIAGLAVLALAFKRAEAGKSFFDSLKITAPGFKYVNSRVITARYSRGLSILIKSGVQVLNAMDSISSLIENRVLENRFQEAFQKVKEGEPLQVALKETGFFPPLFIRMAAIGNDTGHLDEMLDRAANIFDEEVDEAVERIAQMIEPSLIIALSVVVGIILLSVMLPMISIMNAIG